MPGRSLITVDKGYIFSLEGRICTYGHSQLKTGHPVRSAIHKQLNGRLVLRWVTTWESLLLYVLHLPLLVVLRTDCHLFANPYIL
ncbi:hypothetical protein KCU73_g14535, partial [Aureobasidium melanogenum]